jgi:hypothetical protein
MLSIYYHSVGRQLDLRGAPAVLLPPDIRPMPLADALEVLRPSPVRFRDGVWRLVRVVPLARTRDDPIERRYPPELLDVVGRDKLAFLDERRRVYRRGARLLGTALYACMDGDWDEFVALRRLLDRQRSDQLDFWTASRQPLGADVSKLLLDARDVKNVHRSARQVAELQEEVGLDIFDFVTDLGDATAFVDFMETADLPMNAGAATVYPVSGVIRQDTKTLATTAIVTTLVSADFATVTRAVDPLGWPLCSDVIKETRYVEDAFTLDRLPVADLPPIGEGCTGCHADGNGCDGGQLLEERAQLSWGADPNQQGSFHNVLRIHPYSVRPDRGTIDLNFSLARSVKSRILWDERAGGLLLDHGSIKVRPLAKNHWRLTSRKIVKFSDRTPYANPSGWLDTGQLLNYLAPAALTWWLESETYSTGCPIYADHAQVAHRLGRETEGAG